MRYGSDPLKTYLYDSDIDISLIVNNNFEVLRSSGSGNISSDIIFISPVDQLRLVKNYFDEYRAMVQEIIDENLDEERKFAEEEEEKGAVPEKKPKRERISVFDFVDPKNLPDESKYVMLSNSELHKHLLIRRNRA